MKTAYLALLTSIALAAVAAWFSIAGLITIFSASAASIAIMAGVLEVGKLVTASWLYRNWNETGNLLKSYLTFAVLVLMFVTSMGIFGYLSKAHLDQTSPVQNNAAQVERLDNRIAREQQRIVSAERVLAQLDSALETLIEYDKISGPQGMLAVQEQQGPQRTQLNTSIDEAQQVITDLEAQKFQLTSEMREIELEVGPIKYIAELIYEDPSSNIDDAVRIVILIIVLVFDPLAVLLLIAANQTLLRYSVSPPAPVATQQIVEEPAKAEPAPADADAQGFEAKKTAPVKKTEVNINNDKLS